MNAYLNKRPKKPLLGILTMDCEKRGFRGSRENFVDIVKTGRKMGYQSYVITVNQLQLDQPYIHAYDYISGQRKWRIKTIPLPAVIYNRIPYRKHEELPHVKQLLQTCLHYPKIAFYNPSFFYKWTLMEWLASSKLTKKYIPETGKLTERTDLRRWLNKYPTIYLKPEKGRAGNGIMKISRNKSKSSPYILSLQMKKNSQSIPMKSIAEIRNKVMEITKEKKYIIQQGVELIRHQSRPFDMRLLLQKNGKGRWDITGIGARIAGEDSITTHVPRGGAIGKPYTLLSKSFGSKTRAKQVMDKTKKASLFMAKQIEKGSGYKLGEMSMDIGIDRNGDLWFFEANAKPMKFDEPSIRKKSLQQLFEYSAYLANQLEEKRRENYVR